MYVYDPRGQEKVHYLINFIPGKLCSLTTWDFYWRGAGGKKGKACEFGLGFGKSINVNQNREGEGWRNSEEENVKWKNGKFA